MDYNLLGRDLQQVLFVYFIEVWSEQDFSMMTWSGESST